MKKKNQSLVFSALIFIFLIFNLSAQEQQAQPSQKELLFTSALKNYVDDLITELSVGSIGQERFLIQQIRMLNEEISARVGGVEKVRKSYFELLDQRLAEVRALKRRLAPYNSERLNEFLNKVENTILNTLNNGKVDFQKQRAIEDAMQLLYVAEEMIKMDPNARIEKDAELSQDLTKTEKKLTARSLSELSYEDYKAPAATGKKVTIYDLYREWRLTEHVNYELRWTDVQIIKKRLIKEGTARERERMFKRELRQAAEAFNYGFYDLAEKSFAEILDRYSFIGRLDDCLFYKGLSNFLLERYPSAEEDFKRFTRDYPASAFLPQVYKYLMRIAIHFENYDDALAYYKEFLNTGVQGSDIYDEVTFMVSTAALKSRKFDQAISYLNRIGKTSSFYYQAQYLLSEAYIGVNNYTEAEQILQQLAFNEGLAPEFHYKVLLKLGLLNYELGNYIGAVKIFDLIDPSFSQYDRVLLGYAWSYFKLEMNKPSPQQRDFSNAIQNLEVLIDTFYGSDYLLEARTLLAYIHQLKNDVDEALYNYQYVFKAREAKDLSDELNEEQQVLGQILSQAKQLEQKAYAVEDPNVFERAYSLRKKIYKPYLRVSYLDLSSTGIAAKSEVDRLNRQLQELERLKTEAGQRQRKDLVKRIERLQYKIYRAVNMLTIEKPSEFLGLNYFDEHPLARKESVIEFRNEQIIKMRKDLRDQRKEIIKRLSQLDIQIKQAGKEKNYRKLVAYELSKERFQDLLNKLDYLVTKSYAMDLERTNSNLSKWSDFGAFGLTNVKFSVKTMTSKQIEQMQRRIEAINKFLELRRQIIEHKIKQINDQIIVMTRKVRQQERLRKREELNRQFEESYFDTHDTELNYEEETNQPQQKNQQ